MTEGANIQYYPPGGGYFAEHCERTSKMENRCLVWMTYLNVCLTQVLILNIKS